MDVVGACDLTENAVYIVDRPPVAVSIVVEIRVPKCGKI
jgi:hypothetical protein